MIMSIVALLLVGAVAYFHYVQGLFSAVLSAILAIIAAMLAISYHEFLAQSLLITKIPNAAHAMALIGIFAVTYTVLRVIFDSAVPGNVRVPVMVDKVGAGIAGAVAGIFCVGIFLIAAESMPLAPSIGGYSRYELTPSIDVRVPTGRQALDSTVNDSLRSDRINPAEHQKLLIPVDDMVVDLAGHLSDGGSLAGPQSLPQVHPAYLDELFFQRLGIQTGAMRVAYNQPGGTKQVTLGGLYSPATALPQADFEGKFITGRFVGNAFSPTIKSTADNVVLIVRFTVARSAADASDNNVRISPAAVRLVAKGTNYFPIGNLDMTSGALVRVNRLDDFIIADADKPIDFVFDMPADALGVEADPKNPTAPMAIGPGVFLEVKRLGYLDLSNKEIQRTLPADNNGILRKKDLPGPPGAGA